MPNQNVTSPGFFCATLYVGTFSLYEIEAQYAGTFSLYEREAQYAGTFSLYVREAQYAGTSDRDLVCRYLSITSVDLHDNISKQKMLIMCIGGCLLPLAILLEFHV